MEANNQFPTAVDDQLRSLIGYLDQVVAVQGCDNTLRHAQTWARTNRVDWAALGRTLRGRGAFCDCEVPLNLGDR
jgi:hypothetical protein